MTRQKSTTEGGKRAPRVDWVLLGERAQFVDVDFKRITEKDKDNVRSQGFTGGRLAEEYELKISRDVLAAMKEAWPDEKIDSARISGLTDGDNMVSVGSLVMVVMKFDYTEKDNTKMKIKVIGEGEAQLKALDVVRKVKEKYEA